MIVRSDAEVTEQDLVEIRALGGPNVPVLVVSPAGHMLVSAVS